MSRDDDDTTTGLKAPSPPPLPETFWQFIHARGTRLLGLAQGTVALIAGMSDLIPAGQVKYWLGASAILTYWRGQYNANQLRKPE